MGILGTGEPRHWHKADQRRESRRWQHNMKDPRGIEGYLPQHWTDDEKAFVRHLEEHEARQSDPKPSPSDTEQIRTLFRALELSEQQIAKYKQLIVALRQQELEKGDQRAESADSSPASAS